MSKSKADQDRLDAIGNITCVCCDSMKVSLRPPIERHHLVDKGYRRLSGGHQATVSLCSWHHRAAPSWGWSLRQMYEHFGPSMKYQGPPETVFENKGAFERCFGTQRELLEMTNKLLDTVSANY